MQEQTVLPKEKNKKPLIIFLLIISTLSLVAIGFLGFLYAKEMKAQGKTVFNIDGVNPEIANKLSGAINYSSDKEDDAQYFSPTLEITLQYDENLFTVTEGTKTVYISPVNWNLFSSAYLKITPTTDIKGYYLTNSYFQNLKFVEESDDNGVKTLIFSYEESSLLDDTKKTTKTLSVVYKAISEQSVAHIQISNFNIKENESIYNGIKNILNSISTDISDISENLQAQIASGLVKVEFPRSNWSILTQTETHLSFEGTNESLSSITIAISDAYDLDRVKDTEARKKQLQENIDLKKSYFTQNNYNFEIVDAIKTMTIGGIEFEYIVLQYDYGYDPAIIETIYLGFLDGPEKQIDITTRYYTDQAEDKTKIEELLKGITFDNSDIYSMSSNNVLGDSSVTINKATILGQASTVRIFAKECINAKFSSQMTGSGVEGKTYNICSAGFGSGFVVNGEGYIGTNAHVVSGNILDNFLTGSIYSQDLWNDFKETFIALLLQEGINPGFLSEDEINDYYMTLLYVFEKEGYISLSREESSIYVQGSDVFEIDPETIDVINTTSHFKASLINSNEISSGIKAYIEEETGMSDVSDLALIKTDEPINYPAIPVNSNNYTVGQEIYVVGFPGIADDQELVGAAAVLNSTVTKGTISAIKPNSASTFDLLQVDASVDNGNSGGPIIDSDGYVIGVATYGLDSGSGNYNMGISGEELQNFLNSNSLDFGINSERKILEEALSDISLSYYSRAKEKIEGILLNQSSLDVVLQPFVDLCDSKIANGEDKTPFIDINGSIPMLLIFVLLILLLGIAITMLIVKLKQLKNVKTQFIPMANATAQI